MADTAFFMEKGEIRFHGPTAELLERPDVLRSVFLEGASRRARGSRRQRARSPRRDGGRRAAGHRSPTRRAGRSTLARPVGVVRRHPRRRRRVARRSRQARSSASSARTAPARRPCSTSSPGYPRADAGRVAARGRRRHARRAPAGRATRPRPLVPGRAAVPVAHRRGDDRRRLERWIEVRDPLTAALHLPPCTTPSGKVAARVDELDRAARPRRTTASKFVRELSTGTRRVVDLACLLAHRPTVILLDEPSSGIAQRETEALVPLLLRIRDETGASLVVIEHDMPLVRSVADRLVAMDQGAVIADGRPDRGPRRTRRSSRPTSAPPTDRHRTLRVHLRT